MMKGFLLKSFFLSLLIFIFLVVRKVYAADFITDYQIIYDLTNFKNDLSAKVNLNIKITNLKSNFYIDKFTISFSNNTNIEEIEVFDDGGVIQPEIHYLSEVKRVEMRFNDPKVGKGIVNNLFLKFKQKNLFKINGNIWEVFLPVINNQEGNYKIKVILPQDEDKKISIAKPKPTLISGKEIYWENPKTEVIYAVFGDYQTYKVDLIYNLKNPQIRPILTEITFPPDTLYQKVYLDLVTPLPLETYQDDDGNFLGKYFLNPKEEKKVIFKGYIQIFPQWRDEVKKVVKERIKNQKNYLLQTFDKNWQIKTLEKIKDLETISDIYYYVVNNLKYNYQKINSSEKRLGAENTLLNPDNSVCIDFTDLLIGIAREKGITTREIQGYGFSFDSKIQPLSLLRDILHSWVEYYDEKNQIWVPVDPTWENTSKIDYFSSFDLNHITFVIHGKKSDYPVPAGMYKISDSKDISILSTSENLIEKRNLKLTNVSIPKTINANKKHQGKIIFTNQSNVYLYNQKIFLESDLRLSKNELTILSLAPYEKISFSFDLESTKTIEKKKATDLKVFLNNKEVLNYPIKITQFNFKFLLFLPIFFFLFLLIRKK